MALEAGVIRNLISSDPAAADALVVEWRTELRAAIAQQLGLTPEMISNHTSSILKKLQTTDKVATTDM
jgi:Bacterial regulatory proteins, luxR family